MSKFVPKDLEGQMDPDADLTSEERAQVCHPPLSLDAPVSVGGVYPFVVRPVDPGHPAGHPHLVHYDLLHLSLLSYLEGQAL